MQQKWLTRNMALISLSAFFSDMGYQAVLAALPVLLVIVYHAPVYVYGVTVAISYGLGSLMGYIGGRLSDKYGKKKIVVAGNALIPFLSFSGIAPNAYSASTMFSAGWLSRNFRSPARKSMFSDETNEENRGRAFGFLNALDVGGGVLSVLMLVLLIYLGTPLKDILMITAIPITVATVLLVFTKERHGVKREVHESGSGSGAYKGVIIATALYGFSYYSLGFPVLTIAQATHMDIPAFASYGVFLLASALFGYFIGTKKLKIITSLGVLGYLLSAIGTMLLGIADFMHLGLPLLMASVLIIGMAIGTIDTLEPNLITQVKRQLGEGMGALTASRSLGLFFGNLVMGILYYFNPVYSYTYAAAAAFLAFIVLMALGGKYSGKI
ncbi:MAG: MFS transporter [Nitrososphaerota archaeon]|jgi:MFS family permease|nr:MFS transporter [Nitrososphaerota archaeon]MDG6927278.1 MFS transporter [Nitrososphaerota archaeon]MDG6930364.1 MFS transporter [Nitrososphaerota archaeon]MDG6931720.1 MFS transporter [Nitrososphaerota archaeon]MDG6936768.1 MFS transporter [Nitrososphaerota archaeon]